MPETSTSRRRLDGKPLPESEGPLALVSLNGERRGPRHVKWLKSLEARLVDS